jgi:hypothetical protein
MILLSPDGPAAGRHEMFEYVLTAIAARTGCSLITVALPSGVPIGYIAGNEEGEVYACNLQDDPGTVHQITTTDSAEFGRRLVQVLHGRLGPQVLFSGDVVELMDLVK